MSEIKFYLPVKATTNPEIKRYVKLYRYIYHQKPDYLVLSSGTLIMIFGGIGRFQLENAIYNFKYIVEESIPDGYILFCTY